ncbi:hypothetical protein M5D96_011402, partial [Drosophila gunungcola]
GFPETILALILKDVLSALTYIHSQHFVHGSIRAKHILINSRKAVVTNFADCQNFINNGKQKPFLNGLSVENKKQLYWTAPEVLYQNLSGYTEKIDIYSLGITCCEMANGFQPFRDTELTYMYIEKVHGVLPFLLDKNSLMANHEKPGNPRYGRHRYDKRTRTLLAKPGQEVFRRNFPLSNFCKSLDAKFERKAEG